MTIQEQTTVQGDPTVAETPQTPPPTETGQPSQDLASYLDGIYPDQDDNERPKDARECKLLRLRYSNKPHGYISEPTQDPQEIAIFSDSLDEFTHLMIHEAREGSDYERHFRAQELINLLNGKYRFGTGYQIHLLGSEVCSQIGHKVITDENFSIEEAERIISDTQSGFDSFQKAEEDRLSEMRQQANDVQEERN